MEAEGRGELMSVGDDVGGRTCISILIWAL